MLKRILGSKASSNTLIELDKKWDGIPVASSLNNMGDLVQKCLVMPFMDTSDILKSRYYSHLYNKNMLRCIALTVPILGNTAVWLYDKNSYGKDTSEKIALIEQEIEKNVYWIKYADPSIKSDSKCIVSGIDVCLRKLTGREEETIQNESRESFTNRLKSAFDECKILLQYMDPSLKKNFPFISLILKKYLCFLTNRKVVENSSLISFLFERIEDVVNPLIDDEESDNLKRELLFLIITSSIRSFSELQGTHLPLIIQESRRLVTKYLEKDIEEHEDIIFEIFKAYIASFEGVIFQDKSIGFQSAIQELGYIIHEDILQNDSELLYKIICIYLLPLSSNEIREKYDPYFLEALIHKSETLVALHIEGKGFNNTLALRFFKKFLIPFQAALYDTEKNKSPMPLLLETSKNIICNYITRLHRNPKTQKEVIFLLIKEYFNPIENGIYRFSGNLDMMLSLLQKWREIFYSLKHPDLINNVSFLKNIFDRYFALISKKEDVAQGNEQLLSTILEDMKGLRGRIIIENNPDHDVILDIGKKYSILEQYSKHSKTA